MSIFKDQLTFMRHFGQRPGPLTASLYGSLCAEEFEELTEALALLDATRIAGADETVAVTEIADACIDLIYVATGLLHALGLDPQPLWDEVHRSNLDKLRHPCDACDATGKWATRDDDEMDPCPKCHGTGVAVEVRRRGDGKVMKPEGWKPPDLYSIVDKQRKA